MVNSINNDQETEDQSVEDFLKNLKINGRYFTGNPRRREYIAEHRQELDSYLAELKETDSSEAELMKQFVKLNSISRPKLALNLDELIGSVSLARESSSVPRVKSSRGYGYSSRPRKRVENLIWPIGVAVLAIYLLVSVKPKFKDKLENIAYPYVERFYTLYKEIDKLN